MGTNARVKARIQVVKREHAGVRGLSSPEKRLFSGDWTAGVSGIVRISFARELPVHCIIGI
jgi:hypothetical protein